MKTAIVYYSLNGNCAIIAEELKARLGADLLRLHTEKEKPRRGPAGFLWAIGVMLGVIKAPLKPYTFDPALYDLIIIGAPVWGGSPARPIQDFLAKAGITGKKTALFVCHAGGEGNALEQFKALLSGNEVTAEKSFVDPVKNSENAKQQAADWVNGLQAN
ncbi:MAG: flavodoxin [Treponema sp.]|jgi:flavodoxin|nr:flavodoxin [Treponema sp.]